MPCIPSLLESAPVFLSRFEIYPHGHVVAALQRAGAPAGTHDELIVGYASKYPWPEVLTGDEKGELEKAPSVPEGVPSSFYNPPHLYADETCTHISAASESGSRAMFFHEVSVAFTPMHQRMAPKHSQMLSCTEDWNSYIRVYRSAVETHGIGDLGHVS
jgi:hypothetical protein